MSSAPPAASSRDLRIDFFRGFALLFIFTNHLADLAESPLLKVISWRTWGMSDAAELFIFMSGFIYGLVYDRTRARGGARALIVKSWRGLAPLYGANLLTGLFCLVVLTLLAAAIGWRLPWTGHLGLRPAQETPEFLLLARMPPFFDVLAL